MSGSPVFPAEHNEANFLATAEFSFGNRNYANSLNSNYTAAAAMSGLNIHGNGVNQQAPVAMVVSQTGKFYSSLSIILYDNDA